MNELVIVSDVCLKGVEKKNCCFDIIGCMLMSLFGSELLEVMIILLIYVFVYLGLNDVGLWEVILD